MEKKTPITFDDCCSELLGRGATGGREALDRWSRNPRFREVVPFVKGFVHEHLFTLGPGAVQDVISRSTHALGDVESTEQLSVIENFTAPFALQHLFHWYIEEKRSLPTWTDFRNWMVRGPAAPLWFEVLKSRLGEPRNREEARQWSRATRWRVGKFYLSAMREVDLLLRLRHAGIPVRYHLLGDVLLRADLWINSLIVCLYFPNAAYREGKDEGRKPPAEKFFSGATPPFEVVHFPVERQGFGNVWLAKEDSVKALAQLIRPHA